MLAVMITTLFTEQFFLTLVCGLPFLALILLIYYLRFRGQRPLDAAAPKPLPIQP